LKRENSRTHYEKKSLYRTEMEFMDKEVLAAKKPEPPGRKDY